MGDNANKDWEWHNNEVGVGYAAPGVVRQRRTGYETSKIIDMSKATIISEQVSPNVDKSDTRSSKKKKHAKQDNKSKKKSKISKQSAHSSPAGLSFNPFLQSFASQISDTTRHFSVD